MNIGLLFIRGVLRLYPAAWRRRFEDEIIDAWLEEHEAAVRAGRAAASRSTGRTVTGLLKAVIPVHLQQRAVRRVHPELIAPRYSMRSVLIDLRYALRTLRKQPGFAAIAILTLALGIGANTAVFSVLNSVVLSPLPYAEPRQLVRLYEARDDEPSMRNFLTVPDLVDVREDVRAFSSVGISYTYEAIGGDLTSDDGGTRRIRLMPVSADYFPTLRATPLLGRSFTREEEVPDLPRVILSHALWMNVAAGDSAIIGKAVRIDGVSMEVIGVMRPTLTAAAA